jgi:hypothetical protein
MRNKSIAHRAEGIALRLWGEDREKIRREEKQKFRS